MNALLLLAFVDRSGGTTTTGQAMDGTTTTDAGTDASNGAGPNIGGSSPNNGGSASNGTITGSFTISGLSINDLNANPTVKQALIDRLVTKIANAAQVNASNVSVTLTAGSITVTYVITLSPANRQNAASSLRNSIGSGVLSAELIGALYDVPGLMDIRTGTWTIGSFALDGSTEEVRTTRSSSKHAVEMTLAVGLLTSIMFLVRM